MGVGERMKLRLVDYTYWSPILIGEYWTQQNCEKAALDYIKKVMGDCEELTCEQYDYQYEVWISYTPATAAMQSYINSELDRYRKEVKWHG